MIFTLLSSAIMPNTQNTSGFYSEGSATKVRRGETQASEDLTSAIPVGPFSLHSMIKLVLKPVHVQSQET